MNKSKALFIKYLRVRKEYTWRAVQRELSTRYDLRLPFNSCIINYRDLVSTNQIDGMIACEQAMNLLNEKPSDGWN